MSVDVTAAEERFRVWSRVVTAAMFNQMDAAAHVMAERARSLVPAAATLVLEDSDQGDWLSLVGVEDGDGRLLGVGDDLIEIDGGAAACIYSDTAGAVAGVQVRSPGGRHTGVYALTIGRTRTAPVPVEVVVVRDPDAADDVSVWLGGQPPVGHEVAVVCVDAGAGWTLADWRQARDEALVGASPEAGAAIADAYDHPRGSRYITGFDETGE